MKKTAMIVAMACGVLCSLHAGAQECPAGVAPLNFESATWNADRSMFDIPLSINGKALSDPKGLRATYDLNHSSLQVLNRGGAPTTLLANAVSEEADGSLCITFDRWKGRETTRITSFTGVGGGAPAVCVAPSGKVAAEFVLNTHFEPDLRIRVFAPHRYERDLGALIDASRAGCGGH